LIERGRTTMSNNTPIGDIEVLHVEGTQAVLIG